MPISRREFIVCVAAGLSVFATGSLAGCSAASDADSGITTINITEQGKAKRDELKQTDCAAYFAEENYSDLLESITAEDLNVFPSVETTMPQSHTEIAGSSVYKLENDDASCTVFYIHGGSYAFGIYPSQVSLCEKLATQLGAQVLIPLYPLAPNGNCLDAYAFLDAAYEEALSAGKPIYLVGDSAGGGLACAFAEHLRDKGTELPGGLVLFSPWLDVTLCNPDIAAYEQKDIQLKRYGLAELGKLWADSLDTTDPCVSPIYGDVSGLPPTLLVVGTEEIMCPDTTKLYEMLKDANVKTQLVYGEGLWHVYVVSDIPEAASTLDIVEEFCKNI